MAKLIVNTPSGFQELIEISDSGSYFDDSLILWDERTSGAIPIEVQSQVGGLVKRQGGGFTFDKSKQDAQKAAQDAKKAQEDQKKSDRANAHARVKALDLSKNLSAAEVQQAVKDLIAALS